MEPNWIPRLKDVLGHETQEITLTSPRTGNQYTTDAISNLKVVSTGSIEETDDGKYRYSIVDTTKNLEYRIKTDNKVDVKFGTILVFKNVRGGATNRGGWYAADSVEVVNRNA
ncbi:hypothetical protein [Enterococcus casseliflavus]|jgi:hypothetical protein|uniref:hypothetical protein n=1 Tax=Enterococcus casseliflavus TaxID=37734 RepID=UPI0022E5E806|nr:hypothetical protein [Enterococcus casseliflavus]